MNSQWLYDQLSDLLQFPVPQDMIDYVSSIENVRDLEDYMRTLLDFNNSKHKQFLQELLQRRTGSVGYKKAEVQDDYFVPKQEKKKKEKNGKSQTSTPVVKKDTPEPPAQGKKKKFVNLYSQEGQNRQEIMLKGRHKCDCQAGRHKLVNNCLKCGRIVCEQEGSGPCLFCGNLVCSRAEQELISAGTKQSNHLLQRLMDQKPTGYESAIQHRNKLLEYDRTSEKRTRIIDDESDYFSSHSVWLSATEREHLKQKEEEAQARKHQSRKDKKLTLDIGLKQLVEVKDEFDMYDMDEVLRDISNSVSLQQPYHDADNTNPTVHMQPRFDDDILYEVERNYKVSRHIPTSHTKIQDREFLEMVDEGLCLSLHQPWASLLACGIKVHEGRNWYTPHRGRLWIASTVKTPSQEEIQGAQALYAALKQGTVFPLTYPTGCLLGCVNLVDCLPHDEYRQRFPDGESESPFVFICDSPQELPIRFPITGNHKIYKLDAPIHQAAQKALQRLAKIKADKNSIPFIRNS